MITKETNEMRGYHGIYKNKIVWCEKRDGNWNVYLYDMKTKNELPITSNSYKQETAKIYGDLIVWFDDRNGNWDVYMYNLKTKEEKPVCINPAKQYYGLDICEDKIVWDDERNDEGDIYMYDITTDEEIRITNDSHDQSYPEIYGNRIIWRDTRNHKGPTTFGENTDIYMYDLTTKEEKAIIVTELPPKKPSKIPKTPLKPQFLSVSKKNTA